MKNFAIFMGIALTTLTISNLLTIIFGDFFDFSFMAGVVTIRLYDNLIK